MGRFKWFDGNQGAHRYFRFENFDFGQFTVDGVNGIYNNNDGPIDETRQPYRFTAEFNNAEILDANVDSPLFTAGTVSKITWYNLAGDKILEATGLEIDLPYLSVQVAEERFWTLEHIIPAGGHRFVGANDGMKPDGWNGDEIITGIGNDTVIARGGDDFIVDARGADIYRGGAGHDELDYSQTYWQPTHGLQGIRADLRAKEVRGADGEIDQVSSIEGLRGTNFRDVLLGNGQDNRFSGLQGNDRIDGRGGFDTVRYRHDDDRGGHDGVTVNLKKGFAIDGFGTRDRLKSIEGVEGTDYDDVIRDNGKSNDLRGRDGDDRLIASGGDDRLRGDGGDDRFVFIGQKFGNDIVEDYEDGSDTIEIRAADSFDQLTISNDSDGRAVIQFAEGSVTLKDTSAAQLTAEDFIF